MEKAKGNARWWNLVIMWLTYEVNYLDRLAILVFLPFIREDLGLTHAQAGQAASVFFFFYALSQLFLGGLADRVRPTRLMQVAIGVFSLATFLTGYMRNFTQFVILRAALGFGEAIHIPPIFRSIANWFPVQEKGRAMSILTLAWGIGPAFLPPLLLWLYAMLGGWRPVFGSLFVVGIVAIIVIALFVHDDPEKALQKGKVSKEEYEYINSNQFQISSDREYRLTLNEQAKISLGDFSFWAYSLVWFCGLALAWGILAWIPSYLYEQHKFQLAAMGFLAGLPYLFAGAGQLTGGWLADRVFRGRLKWLILSSFLVCVPLLYYLSSIQAGQTIPLMICLAFLGFFTFLIHPVLYGYFQNRYPKETVGFSMGFSNGLGQFGSFTAPLVMGYLVISTGEAVIYGKAFAFLCFIAIGGAVLSLFMSEREYDFKGKLSKFSATDKSESC